MCYGLLQTLRDFLPQTNAHLGSASDYKTSCYTMYRNAAAQRIKCKTRYTGQAYKFTRDLSRRDKVEA